MKCAYQNVGHIHTNRFGIFGNSSQQITMWKDSAKNIDVTDKITLHK